VKTPASWHSTAFGKRIANHRFSKKLQGHDMRLTGVEPAHVVKGVLA
jgi:hypothetical protein